MSSADGMIPRAVHQIYETAQGLNKLANLIKDLGVLCRWIEYTIKRESVVLTVNCGQTGSGKTHTMSSADGMIPRAVHQIYETAQGLEVTENANIVAIQGALNKLANLIKDLGVLCRWIEYTTGSGKTHTMSSADGMIPRAVHQIYETAQGLEEKGSHQRPRRSVQMD
jgi:mannosyltransferase OCH1-like enzyme